MTCLTTLILRENIQAKTQAMLKARLTAETNKAVKPHKNTLTLHRAHLLASSQTSIYLLLRLLKIPAQVTHLEMLAATEKALSIMWRLSKANRAASLIASLSLITAKLL